MNKNIKQYASTYIFAILMLFALLTSCSVDSEFENEQGSKNYLTLNTLSIDGALTTKAAGEATTKSATKTNTIYTAFSSGEIVQIKYDFTGVNVNANTAYAKFNGSQWNIYSDAACTTLAELRPNGRNNSDESWEKLKLSLHFHPKATTGITTYPTNAFETVTGGNAYYDLLSATTKASNTTTAGTYSIGVADNNRGQITANFAHDHVLVTVSKIDLYMEIESGNGYLEKFKEISKLSAKMDNSDTAIPFVGDGAIVVIGWKAILPVGTLTDVDIMLKSPSNNPANDVPITIAMRNPTEAHHAYNMALTLRPDENEITIVTTGIGWTEDELEPITDAIEGRDYSLATPKNKNSAWTLYTAVGLATYRDWVNTTTNAIPNAMLGSSIDMESVCYPKKDGVIELSWIPIAHNKQYTAIFDGNGKTLKNLYINNTDVTVDFGVGLFGSSEGTIKNLNIETVTLTTTQVKAGAIVGMNNGLVTNCTVKDVTIASTVNVVGGIVGTNAGEIIASTLAGTNIITTTAELAGGIAGFNYYNGAIIACTVSGTNTIAATAIAGGIAGKNSSIVVASVITSGAIDAGSKAGAIVGENPEKITSSFAEQGNVIVTGSGGVDNFYTGINSTDLVGKFPIANSDKENLNYAIADWNIANKDNTTKLCDYHFVVDAGGTPKLVSQAADLGVVYVGTTDGLINNPSNPNYATNRDKNKWIITDATPSAGDIAIIKSALDAAYVADNTRRVYIELVNATAIAADAFKACRSLSSIYLPKATTIGDKAFQNCDALNSINMPKAVTIGANAFQDCISLTYLKLVSATTIGAYAFDGCMQITGIELPVVTAINDYAFYDCINIGPAKLPMTKATMTIGTYAFYNCNTLSTIDLISAKTIGAYAFNNCKDLTTVQNVTVREIGSYAFQNCPALTTINLSTVEKVGPYAFQNCPVLNPIDLSVAVTIDAYAFYNCDALVTVNMPKVTYVGGSAFYLCKKLANINLSKVISIGLSAFKGCSMLTEVSLDVATSVGNSAFEDCSSLVSIDMPYVQTLANSVVQSCSKLTHFSAERATKSEYEAIYYCTALETISLPSLTSLGSCTFQSCPKLKTVSLPKVTSVDTYAFDGCGSLLSLDMPKATKIYAYAFRSCTVIETINATGITTIDNNAFENCYKLTTINATGVTTIGNNAFEDCYKLTTINTNLVSKLGDLTFKDCIALRTLTFGTPITSWGKNVLQGTSVSLIDLTLSPVQKQLKWVNVGAKWAVPTPSTNFVFGTSEANRTFCGSLATQVPYIFNSITAK